MPLKLYGKLLLPSSADDGLNHTIFASPSALKAEAVTAPVPSPVNAKFPLGFDLYQVNKGGNDIASWPALAKAASFVYIRASDGLLADSGFPAAAAAAKGAGLQVGAYHVAFPNLSISAQVRVIKSQLAAAGVAMDLPTAIDYEPQPVRDPKSGKVTTTWPSPKDLASFMVDLPGVIIYTNEEGLKIIRAAGLDTTGWKFWYANFNLHQAADGERDILNELYGDLSHPGLLQTYGLRVDQILFFQTADSLPYPDPAISPDQGADYDRAVSFAIGPAPEPAPTDWQEGDAKLEAEIIADRARITVLEAAVFQHNPVPPPVPPPVERGELWTLKTREEMQIPHDGSFNAILGHGQKNCTIDGLPELDWTFSIKGTWFGWMTDNAKLKHWAIHEAGTVYIHPDNLDNPTQVQDPVILCGSTNFMRQQVNVVEWSDDGRGIIGKPGRVARLAGVQRLSSAVAYAATYDPNEKPYLFAWAFTDFLDGSTVDANGNYHPGPDPMGKYGASKTLPSGEALVFVKPLFDPASTFDLIKGTIPGFWVLASGLHERIG